MGEDLQHYPEIYENAKAYTGHYRGHNIITDIFTKYEDGNQLSPKQLHVLESKFEDVTENEAEKKAITDQVKTGALEKLYDCTLSNRHTGFVEDVYQKTVKKNYPPSTNQFKVILKRIKNYQGQFVRKDPILAYQVGHIYGETDLKEKSINQLNDRILQNIRDNLNEYDFTEEKNID